MISGAGRLAILPALLLGIGCRPAPPPLPAWDPADLSSDPAVVELLAAGVRAVAASPAEPELRRRLGLALEANGLAGPARGCYEAALELGADPARVRYRLARVALAVEDLDRAVAELGEVVRLAPDHAPAHWRLGELQLRRGAAEAALASFERAAALEPGSPVARVGLVRSRIQLDDLAGAEALARSLVEDDRSDRYARYLLAGILRRLGRAEEAAEISPAEVGEPPRGADPWDDELAPFRTGFQADLELAQAELMAGRVESALARLELLTARRPDDLTVASNLGAAYVGVGRAADAVRVLEPAVAARPDLWSLSMNFAAALYLAGNPDRAAEAIERTLEMQPLRPRAHELRGMIRLAQGAEEEGLGSLDEAVRLGGDDEELLARVGLLHLQAGRSGRAVVALRALVDLRPDRGDYRFTLARGLLALGELTEASEALDVAERLGGRSPEQVAALRRAIGAAAEGGG